MDLGEGGVCSSSSAEALIQVGKADTDSCAENVNNVHQKFIGKIKHTIGVEASIVCLVSTTLVVEPTCVDARMPALSVYVRLPTIVLTLSLAALCFTVAADRDSSLQLDRRGPWDYPAPPSPVKPRHEGCVDSSNRSQVIRRCRQVGSFEERNIPCEAE